MERWVFDKLNHEGINLKLKNFDFFTDIGYYKKFIEKEYKGDLQQIALDLEQVINRLENDDGNI